MGIRPAGGPAAHEGENTIAGAISAFTPEEGQIRARIGPVTAESSREELDRLGLERGAPARAYFSTANTRLLPLEEE